MNVVLFLVILVLVYYIYKIKEDIKYISKQIEENKDNYVNIRTKVLDKDIEGLATQINYLYDENQKINVKIKSSEEDLRQSIANMSHDLRTPLTSIMGYIQLVEDDKTSQKDKERYIKVIKRRTNTLQNLINSFYELSRFDAKEFEFKLRKVNIENILCENLASFYSEFEGQKIEPIVDIQEKCRSIVSDEAAINRVFSNIISNMIKHGENFVKIQLKEEGDIITTTFTNKAMGLKPDDVERLFDKFFTTDKSRGNNNTGLGLYIAKTIVEKLGNKIQAKLDNENLSIIISWRINNNII